jgi:hypothetical protein
MALIILGTLLINNGILLVGAANWFGQRCLDSAQSCLRLEWLALGAGCLVAALLLHKGVTPSSGSQ